MKKKLTYNFTVNLIQVAVNQFFALLIFFIISSYLSKDSFGSINLALAILMAMFNILGFGIDQLIIKKIAAGENPQLNLSLYCFHTLFWGCIFYGALVIGCCLQPALFYNYPVLLLLGLGKLAVYFSTPFKQAANGMERFGLLACMSVVSGVLRGCILLLYAFLHRVTPQVVIAVFIAGDIAELLVTVLAFSFKTKLLPRFQILFADYRRLLKEAMPQAGVVLITSALSRFDWIFIGLTLSASRLAEYSFAYKLYEISTLPLLALAPLLIPRFTKMFSDGEFDTRAAQCLVRIEMIGAALIVLILNICWQPVIDLLTAGKYGRVNQYTIFILSLSAPLIYLNNFYWTMYFAQGRLKMIFRSFVLSLCVNVALDLALIPFFKNEGAAISVLFSLAAQYVFYLSQNELPGLNKSAGILFSCVACSIAGIITAKLFFTGLAVAVLCSVALYFFLLLLTGQLKFLHKEKLALLLNW